jgi:WD40 repeat protein
MSVYDILYLIYTDYNKSIIAYDISNKKIIIEIKNAHNSYINNMRHYADKANKRDLIISISCVNNNIKLWNVNDWSCIINMENIYFNSKIISACLLFDNNDKYIISSNINHYFILEKCKVFDFKGNKIEEIIEPNNITDNIYFIDSYYDKQLNKNYIITCNEGYIKSYDYKLHKIYHIYHDNENKNSIHSSAIIYKKEEMIKLIDSCYDGNIRIRNFHSGQLLNKIKVYSNNNKLYGLCLWNDDNIIVCYGKDSITIIDINREKIITELIEHNNSVLIAKLINHPKFGKCLLSQGCFYVGIKLWINRN